MYAITRRLQARGLPGVIKLRLYQQRYSTLQFLLISGSTASGGLLIILSHRLRKAWLLARLAVPPDFTGLFCGAHAFALEVACGYIDDLAVGRALAFAPALPLIYELAPSGTRSRVRFCSNFRS